MSVNFDNLLNSSISFTRRPEPIAGDLRPDWRISVLLIILKVAGFRGSSSLEKLYVLNWAIRNKSKMDSFIRMLNGNWSPEDVVVRCEPALIRAIQYAEAEHLIKSETLQNGSYKVSLTDKGEVAVDHILAIKECLKEEKSFLESIKSRVSQKSIDALFKWGTGKWD